MGVYIHNSDMIGCMVAFESHNESTVVGGGGGPFCNYSLVPSQTQPQPHTLFYLYVFVPTPP